MLRTTKVARAGGPEDGKLSTRAQHHLASGDRWHRDLDARERVLTSAIIAADISMGWDEYLEIFDAFYADDVEVTTDVETGAVRGRNGFAHSCSTSLPRFMQWQKLAACLYRFERAQFTETPPMRRIRPGQWT